MEVRLKQLEFIQGVIDRLACHSFRLKGWAPVLLRDLYNHVRTLDEAATRALRELGRGSRVTLNTVIQAAWGLLLSSYSRRDDVVFGVTTSGRPPELDGIESAVGLFINTLPLRLEGVRKPREDAPKPAKRAPRGK